MYPTLPDQREYAVRECKHSPLSPVCRLSVSTTVVEWLRLTVASQCQPLATTTPPTTPTCFPSCTLNNRTRINYTSIAQQPRVAPSPHPTPHIPHHASYTLDPTPSTIHPPPCTLHPTPYTLHPTPCTPPPQPATLSSPVKLVKQNDLIEVEEDWRVTTGRGTTRAGRSTTRAENAQGTSTQSRISRSILVFEDKEEEEAF